MRTYTESHVLNIELKKWSLRKNINGDSDALEKYSQWQPIEKKDGRLFTLLCHNLTIKINYF